MKSRLPEMLGFVIMALLVGIPPARGEVVQITPTLEKVNHIVYIDGREVEAGESSGALNTEALVFEQRTGGQYFLPVGSTTMERANVMNLNPGDYISRFIIGIATDSTTPVSLSVAFYDSDQAFPPKQSVIKTRQGLNAVYEVTFSDLVGDGSVYTGYEVEVNLGKNGFFVPPSGKLSMGTVYTDTGNSTLTGPIIAGPGPGPAPGSQDFYYVFNPACWLDGSYVDAIWFGGMPPATFWCAIWSLLPPVQVPVPSLSRFGFILLGLFLLGVAVLALVRKPSAVRF